MMGLSDHTDAASLYLKAAAVSEGMPMAGLDGLRRVARRQRAAGDPEQAEQTEREIEQIQHDPVGYYFGRDEHGAVNRPRDWPDTVPWQPSNSPEENLRLARDCVELALSALRTQSEKD